MNEYSKTEEISKLPTLLTRGSIVTKDINIKNQIPKDYILERLMDPDLKHKIFVIKSGTGSGKSTVLPSELLLKNTHKKIGVTEISRATAEEIPYDIASRSPDKFVMGENIGFQTGLINRVPSKGNSLLFMTVGILYMHITTLKAEHFMRKYAYIFIDEVHKYDLMTDMVLKEIKRFHHAHKSNPECPIFILMSATLNEEELLGYFEVPQTTQYIEVEGSKGYKITENWPSVVISQPIQQIVKICETNKEKDILIFCPTSKYIKDVKSTLEKSLPKDSQVIEIMSKTIAQGEVKQLLKEGKGRIALATNAIETGLTLPFLDIIIDTGLHLNVAFNPQYNTIIRHLNPITQASAKQRRGRVGRTKDGEYYPLYTKAAFEAMLPQNYAEMYTVQISKPILNMIAALELPEIKVTSDLKDGKTKEFLRTGKNFDAATLGMIHNPSSEGWQYAFQELYQAGFIHDGFKMTFAGYLATKFRKISIQAIRMIFSGIYHKVPMALLLCSAAILQINAHFGPSTDIKYPSSDVIDQLHWYILWKQTTEKKSMNWTREWCETNQVDYEKILLVTEMLYELIFEANSIGLKTDLSALLVEPTPSQIVALKKSIFEGYRSNLMIFNDHRNSFVTKYKNNKVSISRRSTTMLSAINKNSIFAVANEIFYPSKDTFETGEFVTFLDPDITSLDISFL